MERIGNWLVQHELSLNVDKTVFMVFSNRPNNIQHDFFININGNKIERVDSCTYLGVLIDTRLKWNLHINSVVRKIRYLLFVMRKFSATLKPSSLSMIYHALFFSNINYGLIAWGGSYNTHLKKLQSVLNRMLKIVKIDKMSMTIKQSFIISCLMFNYDSLKQKFVENFSKIRKKYISMPKIKNTIGFKNHKIVAIQNFNRLPNSLKILDLNYKTIKKRLIDWIL